MRPNVHHIVALLFALLATSISCHSTTSPTVAAYSVTPDTLDFGSVQVGSYEPWVTIHGYYNGHWRGNNRTDGW